MCANALDGFCLLQECGDLTLLVCLTLIDGSGPNPPIERTSPITRPSPAAALSKAKAPQLHNMSAAPYSGMAADIRIHSG